MINFILTALISAAVTLISAVGVYNYLPLSALEVLQSRQVKLGSTITNIAGTDTLSSSRTTINNNFTNLNDGKIENSTTSVAAITTLANLVTVGTITSGTWTGSVIDVARQGTGTTSPSRYQVILGNAAGGLTVASSTGTTGQYLVSNGSAAYPSWQTSAVDQAIAYTWTGAHTFSTATTTFNATTSIAAPTAKLIIGTSTPPFDLAIGLAVGTSTYFSKGVGIGVATTTNNANLEVTGQTILNNASTTRLTVSNDCEGCVQYMGTTSSWNVVSGTTNITPPAGARFVVIDNFLTLGAEVLQTQMTVYKAGLTSQVLRWSEAGSTNDSQYTFIWSGANLGITEDTDVGGASIVAKVYWYR